MINTLQVFILLRMRYWKLAQEPEVFTDLDLAKEAFEEYTRMSFDDFQSLVDDAGGDPDEILGGPFAGTSLLMLEITCPHEETRIAA
jgi:hypothetical protein